MLFSSVSSVQFCLVQFDQSKHHLVTPLGLGTSHTKTQLHKVRGMLLPLCRLFGLWPNKQLSVSKGKIISNGQCEKGKSEIAIVCSARVLPIIYHLLPVVNAEKA